MSAQRQAASSAAPKAVPEDVSLGFVPAAHGYSRGPDHTLPDCVQPPSQQMKDHATFSRAELARYGLPTPEDVGSLAEWRTLVRHAEHRICSYHTDYFDGHARSHAGNQRSAPTRRPTPGVVCCGGGGGSGGITVQNGFSDPPSDPCGGYQYLDLKPCVAWTGIAADILTNKTKVSQITKAVGYWNVPKLVDPGHFNDSSSTWLGVGGIDNPGAPCVDGTGSGESELLQVGTSSWTALGVTHYAAWYENTGNASNCNERSANLSVNAGDRIFAAAGCPDGPCDWVYIQNQTTNLYFEMHIAPNPAPWSGECIVERPHGGIDPPLANFNYVSFQYCRVAAWPAGASSNTLYGIGAVPNLTPEFWEYMDGGSGACAYPTGFIDSDLSNFTVFYSGANDSKC